MIFIIEFYLTAVELSRKLLSLNGNREREKGGGEWIDGKSLPQFEVSLHFIQS